MAYAPDQDEQFRMAARYVDRILRGASPETYRSDTRPGII